MAKFHRCDVCSKEIQSSGFIDDCRRTGSEICSITCAKSYINKLMKEYFSMDFRGGEIFEVKLRMVGF